MKSSPPDLDVVAAILKHTPRDGSLLDVGCGGGQLITRLKEDGIRVTGLDTSRVCVDSLNAKGVPCIHGSVFTTPIDEQWDVVTCCHVLEHIIDLQYFVSKLATLVKPSGKLYIEVPDSERYTASTPFQDYNLEHVNHFTRESLVALFKPFMKCVEFSERNIELADGSLYPAIYCVFEFPRANNYVHDSKMEMDRIIQIGRAHV